MNKISMPAFEDEMPKKVSNFQGVNFNTKPVPAPAEELIEEEVITVENKPQESNVVDINTATKGTNKKSKKASKQQEETTNFAEEEVLDYYGVRQLVVEGAKVFKVNLEKGTCVVDKGVLSEYLIRKMPAIFLNSRFYLYKDGVYSPTVDGQVKGLIKGIVGFKLARPDILSDVETLWRGDLRIIKRPEQVNAEPYILNVQNGLLDIRTMELKEHRPDHISTIQINAKYDPKATGPNFDKFLNDAVRDQSLRDLLQEMVGYCLTTFTKDKKMIFVLDGKPDSGKSTFFNATLEGLLPKESKSHIDLQRLENEYYVAELYGKTVNIFGDLPASGLHDVGVIKALTGKDEVPARHIFGHPFSFKNTAKLVFSCNGLPKNYSKDTSDGFYKRLSIIPFLHVKKREEMDLKLEDKLKLELNYILLWALEGLKKLLENDFKLTVSEISAQLVQEYQDKNNNVVQFVQHCCEVEEGVSYPSSTLYTAYQEFCKLNGFKPKNAENFKDELVERYSVEKGFDYETKNGKKGAKYRAFKGIKLLKEVQYGDFV